MEYYKCSGTFLERVVPLYNELIHWAFFRWSVNCVSLLNNLLEFDSELKSFTVFTESELEACY